MVSRKSGRRPRLNVKVLVEPMEGTCHFAFKETPRILDPMVWHRVNSTDAAISKYGRQDVSSDTPSSRKLSKSPVKVESPPSQVHDTYAHSKHKLKRLEKPKPKKLAKKLKISPAPYQQIKSVKADPNKSPSPVKSNNNELAVTFSDKEKGSFSSILSEDGIPTLPPTSNRQSILDFELTFEKRCRENDRRQIEEMWKWMTLLVAFALLFLFRGEVVAGTCSIH